MNDKNEQSGYTLVEAVISLVMIAVATLGGIAYYASASKFENFAMHKRLATEIANSKMEDIKNNGYVGLPDPANNSIMEYAYINTGTPPPYQTHFGTIPVTRTVTVNDVVDPISSTTLYKEVRVGISWTEANEATAKNIELTTFITP